MSVIVKLDSLSKKYIENIISFLTLIPVDPKEEMALKNPFLPKIPSKPKIPVLMFHVSEDEAWISIPFRFACSLYNKVLNYELPHIKYSNIKIHTPKLAIELRDIQKPIMELAYSQLKKYSTTTLGVPPGIGKCLSPETMVRLKNGKSVRVDSIKVGDVLFNDIAGATNVLSICNGIEEMVNITPFKGRNFKCNMSHILTLVSPIPTMFINGDLYTLVTYSNGYTLVNVYNSYDQAKDMLNKSKEDIIDISIKNYIKLPKCDYKLFHVGVEYPYTPLSEDPYKIGMNYVFKGGPLPNIAVINNKDVRLQVLAGIIDYSGWNSKGEIVLKYCQSVEDLVLSLGFMAYNVGEFMYISGMYSSIPVRSFVCQRNIVSATHQPFSITRCGVGPYNGFTLNGNGRFLLSDYTVSHNTIMGTMLSYLTEYVTLVLCHRETIMKQWNKTFSKCFPGYESWVWMVGVNKAPPEGSGVPAFIICMDERISQIPKHILSAVGTLIIDEAHLFCTPTRVKCLLSCNPRYVIAETATLPRDDKMHSMIQSIVGVHGVFMKSETPYDFLVVNTSVKVPLEKTRFGTNYGAMCKSLSLHEFRNSIVLDIVITNSHKKYIILVKLSNHVKILHEMFKAYGISTGTLFGKKSVYNDSTVLIGTMSKMGVGFDEENACEDFGGKKSDVVILMNSVTMWQAFEQFRGRVMRADNSTVVWLNDDNSTTKRHLSNIKDWVIKTKGNIIKTKYIKGGIIIEDKKVPCVRPPPKIFTSLEALYGE
jgi:hypothetical protein